MRCIICFRFWRPNYVHGADNIWPPGLLFDVSCVNQILNIIMVQIHVIVKYKSALHISQRVMSEKNDSFCVSLKGNKPRKHAASSFPVINPLAVATATQTNLDNNCWLPRICQLNYGVYLLDLPSFFPCRNI